MINRRHPEEPPVLELAPLFTLDVRLAAPKTVYNGPHGERRLIDVLGGTFTGERLSGEVLPGGADFQLVRPDGVAEIDVRAALRTDEGDLVDLTGRGLRHGPAEVPARPAAGEQVDPASYYFRECRFFDAGAPRVAWLNRVVTVAHGARARSSAKIDVFEVR
ncbi:DUF3237 domain-containing protein [Amycolatopsis sp. NPDC051903]|uniref:DUF3237 domain-containing protein n=1 Tax=Amycolatopsis sp. NPDC051903 TaxID=3363936 RepID=UPI0037955160